jgi:hypothetical protein
MVGRKVASTDVVSVVRTAPLLVAKWVVAKVG